MDQETNRDRKKLFWSGFLFWIFFMTLILVGFKLLLPTSDNHQDKGLYSYLTSAGKANNDFDEFISQIRNDFKDFNPYLKNSDVMVFIGYYRMTITNAAVFYPAYDNKYYIIIDEEFYNSLEPLEQKAVVAHEMGHLVHLRYIPTGSREANTTIHAQVLADAVAAKYVGSDVVISMILKIPELRARMESLNRIRARP